MLVDMFVRLVVMFVELVAISVSLLVIFVELVAISVLLVSISLIILLPATSEPSVLVRPLTSSFGSDELTALIVLSSNRATSPL